MTLPTLLVTGASGQLGRRVLDILIARGGARLVAATRNPAALGPLVERGVEVRRADFDDAASLDEAFRGVDRALLVSTDSIDPPGKRREQQIRAAHALDRASVKHVIYTSAAHVDRASTFPIFVDHRATEEAILAARYDSTLLRNNLYADLLLQALPPALATGKLVDAKGNGKTAFVTREDCARVAAAALASNASGRRAFDITGPTAVSSDEVASLSSEIFGRNIEHLSVSVDDVKAALVEHGLPRGLAEAYAGFDAVVSRNELAIVTNAVELLTGKPPQSVRDFLASQRSRLTQ